MEIYKRTDGQWSYPENDGFLGSKFKMIMAPKTKIDRFGEDGSYFSPVGTPFEKRALPPDSLDANYHVFEVTNKPLPFLGGKISPGFDQPGGGTQYQINWGEISKSNHIDFNSIEKYSGYSGSGKIAWLLDNGYLNRLTPPGGIPP